MKLCLHIDCFVYFVAYPYTHRRFMQILQSINKNTTLKTTTVTIFKKSVLMDIAKIKWSVKCVQLAYARVFMPTQHSYYSNNQKTTTTTIVHNTQWQDLFSLSRCFARVLFIKFIFFNQDHSLQQCWLTFKDCCVNNTLEYRYYL